MFKKAIEKGIKIGKYTGKKITKKKLDRKYPGKNTIAAYAICKEDKPHSKCIDAYKTTHGAPRFAKDGKRSNLGANSILQRSFKLVSTGRISANT